MPVADGGEPSQAEACRFDMGRVDVPLEREATQSFTYLCECGLWHWCIPQFEVDGTTDTSAAANTAILDTLDRYYLNVMGVTYRDSYGEATDREHDHPEWRPLPR